MIREWICIFIAAISCVSANQYEQIAQRHAISYDLGGGRFGDKLLGYSQARYLSYITHVPFLYRAFPYSEQLTVEFQALAYDQYASKYAHTFHINSSKTLTECLTKIRNPQTPPTLFILDYFPSDISEWEKDHSRQLLLNIPWHDPDFFTYLKQSTQPRIAIPHLKQNGRLNVADHVRTLSGADTPDTSMVAFPLKHPDLEYHKRQIRRVYEWNLGRPMHVFLFSDTKDPSQLLQDFRRAFRREDITFDIQYHNRVDTDHVLQDFFAMQQFDVLIATQSNFSMMAARLGSFDMVLFPVHAIGQYPHSQIDRTQVISKKTEWFPYSLNAVLKEELR
jgi:hypothetical protein